MKIRYIIFLSILILVSCTKKSENYFSSFKTIINLHGERINLEIPFKDGSLYLYDSLIIFTNTLYKNRYIHLFDRKGLKYLTSSGLIGRGPGEIINPFFAIPDNKRGIIWCMDHGRREILKFPIDSIMINPDFLPSFGLPVPAQKYIIIHYEPYNDELFSFYDDDPDILISFFNQKGEILDSLQIENKIEILKQSDPAVNQNIVSYIYKFHPLKNKIAIAFRFSDILAVVDNKGNIINIIQGPDKINQIPDYSNPDLIVTYFDVVTDAKYVYCLYNEEKKQIMSTSGNRIPTLPKKLHVFDWEGNPIAQINFEFSVCSVVIDRCYKRIITFSPEIGDIVCYELPL